MIDLDAKLNSRYVRMAARLGVCPVYLEACIDPQGTFRKRDVYAAFHKKLLKEAIENEKAQNESSIVSTGFSTLCAS